MNDRALDITRKKYQELKYLDNLRYQLKEKAKYDSKYQEYLDYEHIDAASIVTKAFGFMPKTKDSYNVFMYIGRYKFDDGYSKILYKNLETLEEVLIDPNNEKIFNLKNKVICFSKNDPDINMQAFKQVRNYFFKSLIDNEPDIAIKKVLTCNFYVSKNKKKH